MSCDNWFENFFGPDYLLVYEKIGDEEKVEKEVDLLVSVLKPEAGCAILDIPCGFGRHSLELARRGFDVTAVDLNKTQLDKAGELMDEAGIGYRLLQGDMRDEMFHEEFDLLLNIFTSFGYFSTDEENEKVARNFHSALRPGGFLAVDTINRDAVIANFQPRSWHSTGEKTFNLEERSYDPVTGRMNNKMILVGPDIYHEQEFSLRVYTLNELIRVFEKAGFKYVKAYDGVTGEDYTVKSFRILLVMEKTGEP